MDQLHEQQRLLIQLLSLSSKFILYELYSGGNLKAPTSQAIAQLIKGY